MTTGKVLYKQQYSRSSFLLLNDGKNYKAYVMTIIADSAYINNDLSKLSLTTYRKRDPDFSGVVVYFTPTGKFVSSYGYKNGTLIPGPSANTASTGQNTNSINTSHLKTDEIAISDCLAWFLDTYDINGDLISSVYLYTTCPPDPGEPGTGGGTSPAAPTPCTPSASTTPPPADAAHFTSDVAQPTPAPVDGDGGLPPPTTTTATEPCPVAAVSPDTLQIKYCDGLTQAERNSIQGTVDAFKTEDCASKFLYNYFGNQSFNFCITPGGYNVIFSPQTNTFTFSTDEVATPDLAILLEHEFFHAFQNAIYPGGTASYGQNAVTGVNSPGFVNIEFEQAVFNDIATGNYNAFINGTQQQKTNYENWIKGLTANGTVYPKLAPGSSAYTTFINNYNSFLSQYNDLPNNVNSSPMINLTPQAFIDIFNNINPTC